MKDAKNEVPTSAYHPATHHSANVIAVKRRISIPRGVNQVTLSVGNRPLRLTNLGKPFWPTLGITKGDLLQYYVTVSDVLLPHLRDRAMVMKRYPNGAHGDFFFMKQAPSPRPEWIEICSIDHASGNVINFPIVRDLPSLLWIVNLGCIDLNQWYATCDDVDRPDYMHFDLDPVPGASFKAVLEVALLVRDTLSELKMPSFVKTSGGKGMHVYVPIVRGPLQKQVWSVAKAIAHLLEEKRPNLVTTVYRVADRPRGHVLVDYNQNAWGRTLASVYSVRPMPQASVSAPVSWEEVENGIRIEEFRIDNMPARIRERGDLWKPLIRKRGRVDLKVYF